MSFPETKFNSPIDYLNAYFEQHSLATKSVDAQQIANAISILEATYEEKNTLFVCGNGGSASIANHLACDHGKLLATDTELLPHIHSLAANVEVITAIANDISYDDVFIHQLKLAAKPKDVLMTISSSGDSENVVRAAKWAMEMGMSTIALTGFDGGRTATIANVNLHVNANNYGIIEDIHQSLMHLMGQYIRQARMATNLINERKF